MSDDAAPDATTPLLTLDEQAAQEQWEGPKKAARAAFRAKLDETRAKASTQMIITAHAVTEAFRNGQVDILDSAQQELLIMLDMVRAQRQAM